MIRSVEQQDVTPEDFVRATTFARLTYLWCLQARGHPVDDAHVMELERELYPEAAGTASHTRIISQVDVVALQAFFSTLEDLYGNPAFAIKADLHRLEWTVLIMRPERNHARPHFHIKYKRQYAASYDIDTFAKLAGDLPARYEKPMLNWARGRRDALLRTWNAMQAGEIVTELILEAPEGED